MTKILADIPAIDEEDSFQEEGEDNSYNFREIMDMLIDKKDLIITVPNDQVEVLKKGLYARKSKDIFKLTRAGVRAPTDILSFSSYAAKDADGKDSTENTCVRVKLGARKGVTVLAIEIPDNEI